MLPTIAALGGCATGCTAIGAMSGVEVLLAGDMVFADQTRLTATACIGDECFETTTTTVDGTSPT